MIKSLSAALLSAGLLAASVAAQDDVTCVDVKTGDNLLINPSFEEGKTDDWNYWAPINELNTEDFTDGTQSLSFGGNEGSVVFQTITTFEIGKTYRFDLDYKGTLLDGATPPSGPQHCWIIFELDDPYPNSVDFQEFTYTPGEESPWLHVGGTWTATVTSASLAFYPDCQEDPNNDANLFNSGNFRFLIDNGDAKEQTQSCTTSTSSSTTSTSTTSTPINTPTLTPEPNPTPSNTPTDINSTPLNTPSSPNSTPSNTPTLTPVSMPSTTTTPSTGTPPTTLSASTSSSTPTSSPTTTSRGRCGQVKL